MLGKQDAKDNRLGQPGGGVQWDTDPRIGDIGDIGMRDAECWMIHDKGVQSSSAEIAHLRFMEGALEKDRHFPTTKCFKMELFGLMVERNVSIDDDGISVHKDGIFAGAGSFVTPSSSCNGRPAPDAHHVVC